MDCGPNHFLKTGKAIALCCALGILVPASAEAPPCAGSLGDLGTRSYSARAVARALVETGKTGVQSVGHGLTQYGKDIKTSKWNLILRDIEDTEDHEIWSGFLRRIDQDEIPLLPQTPLKKIGTTAKRLAFHPIDSSWDIAGKATAKVIRSITGKTGPIETYALQPVRGIYHTLIERALLRGGTNGKTLRFLFSTPIYYFLYDEIHTHTQKAEDVVTQKIADVTIQKQCDENKDKYRKELRNDPRYADLKDQYLIMISNIKSNKTFSESQKNEELEKAEDLTCAAQILFSRASDAFSKYLASPESDSDATTLDTPAKKAAWSKEARSWVESMGWAWDDRYSDMTKRDIRLMQEPYRCLFSHIAAVKDDVVKDSTFMFISDPSNTASGEEMHDMINNQIQYLQTLPLLQAYYGHQGTLSPDAVLALKTTVEQNDFLQVMKNYNAAGVIDTNSEMKAIYQWWYQARVLKDHAVLGAAFKELDENGNPTDRPLSADVLANEILAEVRRQKFDTLPEADRKVLLARYLKLKNEDKSDEPTSDDNVNQSKRR